MKKYTNYEIKINIKRYKIDKLKYLQINSKKIDIISIYR